MNVETKKMLDNHGVLSKVDMDQKACKECKIKQVYKATEGFVPVFCPADCVVQIEAGYIPITVMVDIESRPIIKKNNNLKVA